MSRSPSTARAPAATSASPRRPRSSPRAGTNSCWRATRRRCRTPTTTIWRISKKTAPIPSCRASPPGRSRPQQLITIGEIAQKYRLYTKITGGQRIDLLGAQRASAAADLAGAGRRRIRVRARLRQVLTDGQELRRLDLVPLRRAGQRRPRARARASLQGSAFTAQDQIRRVRLHARVRRSAGQGCWRDRDREGLEPLRLWQWRHEAAPCRAAGRGSRPADARSSMSIGS